MKSMPYTQVLAEYVKRFSDQPPTIVADEAALELMEVALRRGKPITAGDLRPGGAPTMQQRRDTAA